MDTTTLGTDSDNYGLGTETDDVSTSNALFIAMVVLMSLDTIIIMALTCIMCLICKIGIQTLGVVGKILLHIQTTKEYLADLFSAESIFSIFTNGPQRSNSPTHPV